MNIEEAVEEALTALVEISGSTEAKTHPYSRERTAAAEAILEYASKVGKE